MSSREMPPGENQPPPADAEIQQLAEQLYRERVAEARSMPPEEKLLAGEELFEYACAITLAGIRNQFPGLSADQHHKILEQRLALREEMEKGG
jgi:hypothetical protein